MKTNSGQIRLDRVVRNRDDVRGLIRCARSLCERVPHYRGNKPYADRRSWYDSGARRGWVVKRTLNILVNKQPEARRSY